MRPYSFSRRNTIPSPISLDVNNFGTLVAAVSPIADVGLRLKIDVNENVLQNDAEVSIESHS